MNERSRPPKAVHSKSLFHLFCFFLFGAGYVEPYIPNGTTYVAGVTGVVALLCGAMHFLQRKKKIESLYCRCCICALHRLYAHSCAWHI